MAMDNPQIVPVHLEKAPAPRKKGTKRAILLFVVLVATLTAVYFSPIRSWLGNAGRLREIVRSLGIWVYPVGILSIAMLVGCGVPRLLLCTSAGTMLGFWGGLLVGELGTVLGYYGVFMFIRWGGREWALHRWPKLNTWADRVKGQGIVGVILLRQMPIHGTLTNLGLGLSGMKQRQFLIGTAIGIIPESIPAVIVGTSLVKGSTKAIAASLGGAAIAFAVIWIVCGYAMRKMRKSRIGADLLAEEAFTTDEPQAGGGS